MVFLDLDNLIAWAFVDRCTAPIIIESQKKYQKNSENLNRVLLKHFQKNLRQSQKIFEKSQKTSESLKNLKKIEGVHPNFKHHSGVGK